MTGPIGKRSGCYGKNQTDKKTGNDCRLISVDATEWPVLSELDNISTIKKRMKTRQNASSCYQPAKLAKKKSDWPTLDLTDWKHFEAFFIDTYEK